MERRKLSESIERCVSDSKFRPTFGPQKITKVRLAVRKCELRLDDKVVLRSEDFGKWTKDSKVEIEIRIEPGALEFMLPGSKTWKRKLIHPTGPEQKFAAQIKLIELDAGLSDQHFKIAALQ